MRNRSTAAIGALAVVWVCGVFTSAAQQPTASQNPPSPVPSQIQTQSPTGPALIPSMPNSTITEGEARDAIVLLDRIRKVIDDTQTANLNTANMKGTVTISRESLDEIGAAADQVKAMLQDGVTP